LGASRCHHYRDTDLRFWALWPAGAPRLLNGSRPSGPLAAFWRLPQASSTNRYQRRKSERYAQAQLIDGWLKNPEFGERVIYEGSRSTMKLIGYVSNASRAAVRDVRFEIRPNPRTESPLFEDFRADVGTVPPTRDDEPFEWSHEFTAGVEYAQDVDFHKSSLRGYILWIRFTDTAGRRWVRHPDGRLEEVGDVAHERATELEQLEIRFPGYIEALQNSPTPEKAFEKFRELKSQRAAEAQTPRGGPDRRT
jgi:hypothetical protein